MDYLLRAGTPGDLDALHALDILCFDEVFRFSRAAMRRFSQGFNKITLVAETAGGELAGFCILSLHFKHEIAYVVTLDVAPRHRRHGLAGLLMQTAEDHATHEGLQQVQLHVFAGNTAAQALYQRRGYRQIRFEKEFYGSGLDAFELSKQLTPLPVSDLL